MSVIPARTSALKLKRIPREDATLLDAYLRRLARSSYAIETADWLRSGLLTGLRPCEWRDARILGDYLIVATAKATNGRGNGTHRHLDVSALSDADRAVLDRHVSRGVGWALLGDYTEWQRRAGDTLHAACRRIWPSPRRHYTLYSARHQCLATSKRTMSPAEVSALAGHATEREAQRAYGRRGSGWREAPGAAQPIPSEVATVRPWVSRFGKFADVGPEIYSGMRPIP